MLRGIRYTTLMTAKFWERWQQESFLLDVFVVIWQLWMPEHAFQRSGAEFVLAAIKKSLTEDGRRFCVGMNHTPGVGWIVPGNLVYLEITHRIAILC